MAHEDLVLNAVTREATRLVHLYRASWLAAEPQVCS